MALKPSAKVLGAAEKAVCGSEHGQALLDGTSSEDEAAPEGVCKSFCAPGIVLSRLLQYLLRGRQLQLRKLCAGHKWRLPWMTPAVFIQPVTDCRSRTEKPVTSQLQDGRRASMRASALERRRRSSAPRERMHLQRRHRRRRHLQLWHRHQHWHRHWQLRHRRRCPHQRQQCSSLIRARRLSWPEGA